MKLNTPITYAIIVMVVAVAVLAYAYLHNPSSYSVSVTMRSLNSLSGLYPLQTEVLQAVVKNTGSSNIQGMTAVLYLNNTVIDTYSVSIAAGTSTLINATYTYQLPGNYSFDIVADPAGLLNIQDRQSAHAAISASVGVSQNPNPYLYSEIPNAGVNTVQSFSLQPGGISTAAFLAANYNTTLFRGLMANGQSIVLRVLQDFSNYTAADGTYVTYNDSSSIYEAWLQSQYGPYAINRIVSSFNVNQKNISITNASATMAQLTQNTTMCYYYYGGWTKLFVYTNQNTSKTCATVLQNSYAPQINGTFVQALKADQKIAFYQNFFHYTNSTNLGSSLLYSGNSIGALNLFVQPTYQVIFGSLVQQTPKNYNVSASTHGLTCTGLTYSVNGIKTICATVMVPKGGTFGASYTLLNSTEITSNYIVSLYSLMNTSNIQLAYQNSGRLIQYLNVSGTPYVWGSVYANKCIFANVSLGCGVYDFNSITKVATFQITNEFTNQITLNQMSCYESTTGSYYPVNAIVGAGANVLVNTTCSAYYIPNTFGYITTYQLIMNYTINGANKYVSGIANITSLQQH